MSASAPGERAAPRAVRPLPMDDQPADDARKRPLTPEELDEAETHELKSIPADELIAEQAVLIGRLQSQGMADQKVINRLVVQVKDLRRAIENIHAAQRPTEPNEGK